MLLGIATGLTVVASGRLFKVFDNPIGLCLVGVTGWMMIATPFSVWRGGSVDVLMVWTRSIAVFVMVASLLHNLDHLRRAIYAIALGSLLLAVSSLLLGTMQTGRLRFGVAGRFSNPNDLAQGLLISLPFWWLMFRNCPAISAKRPIVLIGVLPMLYAIMMTGSRAAMVTSAGVAVLWFLYGKPGDRVKLILAVAALLMTAILLVPSSLQERYTTLTEPEEVYYGNEQVEFASYSAQARLYHLRTSAQFALTHPLFGVGPGQYAVAEQRMAEEEGRRGAWRVTHNAYTQIGCEAGLPALAMYLLAMFFCWRQATSVYRLNRNTVDPRRQQLRDTAFALMMSLCTYALIASFSSLVYQVEFPLIAGLIVALGRVAKTEFSADPQARETLASSGTSAHIGPVGRSVSVRSQPQHPLGRPSLVFHGDPVRRRNPEPPGS